MCRLLFVNSKQVFDPAYYLTPFAEMCKNSKEYQGHGWGIAIKKNESWIIHKSITPIWEEPDFRFEPTNTILVHARSAFEDRDIMIENNMPFIRGSNVFIFNGELRGVKLKMEGRIGAEKIFNFVLRLNHDKLKESIEKAVKIIISRSSKIRGMNFIIANEEGIYLNSYFEDDEEYYTMHKHTSEGIQMICSEKLGIVSNWEKINNNTREYLEWL